MPLKKRMEDIGPLIEGVVSRDRKSLARAITIVEGDAERLTVHGDRLEAVELADGRMVRCEALFVPPRFVPNDGLLVGLGCKLDDDGWAIAGANGLTSVPGVWVAGNVANPRAQVITAAGKGSAAAIAINADLVEEDVRTAVRASRENREPTQDERKGHPVDHAHDTTDA